jgi:quercetin dioxygenase-like cupin family protein
LSERAPMISSTLRLMVLVFALAGVAGLFAADQPAGFSCKVLLDQDLATAGKHGAIALIEFQPGGVAPKHTHPGEELLYVVAGSVSIEFDGQTPHVLKAGDTLLIPAGVAHLGRNPGTVPAKIISTYFLEKGHPLASPVK